MPRANQSLTQEQIDKIQENEDWFRIVVKVLRWKDEAVGFRDHGLPEKITMKEWKTYCDRMLQKNVIAGKKVTQAELEKTKAKIQQFGGFE